MLKYFKHRCLVALLLWSCALAHAGDEEIFRDRFEPGPVSTSFDVAWSSDTELLEGDAVDALISIDASGEVFTFSTAALDDAGISLVPGKVMVLEGISLRRTDSVNTSGGTTVVSTSQASLNEAIDSGEMAWELDVGFNELATAEVLLADRGIGCSPAYNPDEETVTFECSFDDYTMRLTLTRGTNSSSIQYQVIKGDEEDTNASFTGTGVLTNFDSGGSASFSGGELESFRHDASDAQMDINITLAAAGSGSNDLNYEVPFPVIRIPFTVGPIPMSIDIGVQFVAVLEVPAQFSASATATADFRYRGDTGFTYEGSSVDTSATINDHEFSNGAFDSAAPIGVQVDAGFGIAFPRVSLNVLTSEVAWLHTGFILQSHLFWGPVCKEGLAKLVVEGGYKLEILGVELLSDKQTFAQRERREPPKGCQ